MVVVVVMIPIVVVTVVLVVPVTLVVLPTAVIVVVVRMGPIRTLDREAFAIFRGPTHTWPPTQFQYPSVQA